MPTHVIVLAAGAGTRMVSDRAKVLHEAAGRPLVSWMCDLAASVEPATTVVVVGHQADEVTAILPVYSVPVVQPEQRGTAHATEVGLTGISADPDDAVVVLPGDMPLIRATTLRRLVEQHRMTHAAATVLTVRLADPSGYGRVIREGHRILRIVEHRDASVEEREIVEINTAVYAFRAADLEAALASVASSYDQGERYLTDVIEILVRDGRDVGSLLADEAEGQGVNTLEQLAAVSAELERRSIEDTATR